MDQWRLIPTKGTLLVAIFKSKTFRISHALRCFTFCLRVPSTFTSLQTSNCFFQIHTDKALLLNDPPVHGEFYVALWQTISFDPNCLLKHSLVMPAVIWRTSGNSHGLLCSPALLSVCCTTLCLSLLALKVDAGRCPLEVSPYALPAPGIILGTKVTTRFDLWALGCIVIASTWWSFKRNFYWSRFLHKPSKIADRQLAYFEPESGPAKTTT
jgi:hypothetical protein